MLQALVNMALDALDWVRDEILPKVVLAMLLPILGILGKIAHHQFRDWRRLRRLPKLLEDYQKTLAADTFERGHIWMRSGHTLQDVLVPVEVRHTGTVTVSYDKLIRRYLSSRDVGEPHEHTALVLTGPPGAGKSVALFASQAVAWELTKASERGSLATMPRYVPLTTTFADLVKHTNSVEAAMLAGLRRLGFAQNDPDPDESRKWFFSGYLVPEGRALLLIDGLDELEAVDQPDALYAVLDFVETKRLRCVLTCRKDAFDAVRGAFMRHSVDELAVLDFPLATARRFIAGWPFGRRDARQRLLSMVRTNPHLERLSRNPLLLTIMCFLQSEGRLELPQQRAELYRRCTQALLEGWARAQLRKDRLRADSVAHQLPSGPQAMGVPDKEELLARLAGHMQGNAGLVVGLPERHAISSIRDSLKSMGHQGATAAPMVDHLIADCGLLVRDAEGGIRFAHRTFQEYFLAHFHTLQGTTPSGADEVALLFCGLNREQEQLVVFVRRAIADDRVALALELLWNAEQPSEEALSEALTASQRQLAAGQVGRDLVESLGNIARSSHGGATAATEQLSFILEHPAKFEAPVVDAGLRALCAIDEPKAAMTFVRVFEHFPLPETISAMSEATLSTVGRELLAGGLVGAGARAWITGLQRAEAVEELCRLMKTLADPDLRTRCAIALASMSRHDGFWKRVSEVRALPGELGPQVEHALAEWGWPGDEPETADGQRFAVGIAIHVAASLDSTNTGSIEDVESPLLDPMLYYLTHAFAWDATYWGRSTMTRWGDAPVPALPATMYRCTPRLVKDVWRRAGSWAPGPERLVLQVSFGALSLAPLALLGTALTAYFSPAPGPRPSHSMTLLMGISAVTLFAWGWVRTRRRALPDGFSFFDLAMSTVLGPMYVIREAAMQPSSKRKDDAAMAFLLVVYAGVLLAALALVLVPVSKVVVALCIVDLLVQANRRVGVVRQFSSSARTLADFLAKCVGRQSSVLKRLDVSMHSEMAGTRKPS